LLAQYPERENSLPEAERMEEHFRIHYLKFEVDAGYRWPDRLV
jgi:hypothetical protein